MNKTDFAELKEKLCRKIYVDIYVQREHDTAIISELIEIIKSQSEALEEITGQHSDLCQVMKPVRPSYVCHVEVAAQSLSETTTRLQKLRDGK